MSNNCLVTKLKSVVNNDNLSYLNAVAVTYKGRQGYDVVNTGIAIPAPGFKFTGTAKVLSNNGHFTNDSGVANYGTEVVYTDESSVYVKPDTSDAEVKVLFMPKNSIQYYSPNFGNIVKVKLSDFNYCENLKYFSWEISDSAVDVDIVDILNLYIPSLQTLECYRLAGNVELLANMASLQSIRADGGKLVGDVTSLISAKRAMGETTGSYTLTRLGYQVMLNGHTFTSKNVSIIWDASSIIIKPDLVDDIHAYTYNASSAQITELESQGYTVVVCD